MMMADKEVIPLFRLLSSSQRISGPHSRGDKLRLVIRILAEIRRLYKIQ